ncbi:MAG: exopolysaccharide biosynthesis polyprenyl glycosylphosphotransferase, partial [Anaerolineales bacterium]|nr:exopolysaccharide biosynthesis polyprenyl glycosylphosphotransferase [Anaerolineales bacterium]
RGGWQYSRAILLLFWFFSIGFVMAGRFFARTIGSKLETWGVPVVLLSDIPKGRELLEALLSNRKAGLKLVAYLTPDGESHPHESLITGPYSLAEKLRKELGVSTAIIVTTSLAGRNWIENVDQFCAKYSRVFLVSDLLGQRNLWIQPADIVGNLGLEISQNLDSWSARFLKDLMDISISFVAALFSLPLLGLIALAIKLDSKGHVFYSHDRIGKDGKRIRMLKFRTMYSDADERLEGLLDSDEVLSIEWDLYQKLKDDPRITHVGKWLRRWSLDELPQILNVVRREMSLIGPRPMTFGQEEKYGRDLNLYKKVRPGLTGLWQVSGRNLTTFEQRAMYDAYYVRNWSIWLDLYILAKTPLVIFRGEGVS